MAIQKKTGPVPPEVAADARERAKRARDHVEAVGRAGLLSAEDKANGAPFYFVLRNYIRQLKAAREAAGLTLTEVASRSGMALESLSRLETGAQTNPTWRTLGLYAVAIGCAPVLTPEAIPNAAGPSGTTGGAGATSSATQSSVGPPIQTGRAAPNAINDTKPPAVLTSASRRRAPLFHTVPVASGPIGVVPNTRTLVQVGG